MCNLSPPFFMSKRALELVEIGSLCGVLRCFARNHSLIGNIGAYLGLFMGMLISLFDSNVELLNFPHT